MLNIRFSLRTLCILGFLFCSLALLSAIYLENHYTLSPCPMCMLQRMVFAAMGIVFLLGAIVNFQSILRFLTPILILLLSSLGFLIAARQFWLQYFAPPQMTSCAASLQRLIQAYPFLDALKIALNGSPECQKIDFTIFTISIAGWSVFIFGTFVIITLYIIYLQNKRRL